MEKFPFVLEGLEEYPVFKKEKHVSNMHAYIYTVYTVPSNCSLTFTHNSLLVTTVTSRLWLAVDTNLQKDKWSHHISFRMAIAYV